LISQYSNKEDVPFTMQKLVPFTINEEYPTVQVHKVLVPSSYFVSGLKQIIFNLTGYFPQNQRLLVNATEIEDEKPLSSFIEETEIVLRVDESEPEISQFYWDPTLKTIANTHFFTQNKLTKIIASAKKSTISKEDVDTNTQNEMQDPIQPNEDDSVTDIIEVKKRKKKGDELESKDSKKRRKKEEESKEEKKRKQEDVENVQGKEERKYKKDDPMDRKETKGKSTGKTKRTKKKDKEETEKVKDNEKDANMDTEVTEEEQDNDAVNKLDEDSGQSQQSAKDDIEDKEQDTDMNKEKDTEKIKKKSKKKYKIKNKEKDNDEDDEPTQPFENTINDKTVEENKVESDNDVAFALPDRIISIRSRLGSTEYRIRWQGHGAHEDSWAERDKMLTKYPALLEDWENKQENENQSKRKRSNTTESIPAPPSKKRSLPITITKEKILRICGVKHKENNFRWVVELKDGTHPALPGEELIKLSPSLFLSYVENNIKKIPK